MSVLSLDEVELVGRVVRLVVRPEFDGGAQNQLIRLRRERVQNHISVTTLPTHIARRKDPIMANKRLEPKHVIVPLDPIDRVSSITRPESRKSVLIHLGVDLEGVLETGEEVLDRSTAPVCLDAVGEGLAERGGAGWVDGDDEVALLGED